MNIDENTQSRRHLEDDEIDLRLIFGSLWRRRYLIAIITVLSAGFGGIHAFRLNYVWEGQFQIVLEQSEGNAGQSTLSDIPIFSNFMSGSSASSLSTEVEILQSPSVLRPVYEFAKALKVQQGSDVEAWRFSNWLGSVDVELVNGTTVLTVAYQDTDKDQILPVLNKISTTYQEYSGRDRERGLKNGMEYLDQEIKKLKLQSAASMRAAQAFALNHDLGLQGDSSAGSNSVDMNRQTATNKVNALRQQIIAAQKAGSLQVYQAPQQDANSETFSKLQRVEAELKEKLALLTPKDPTILSLERQRKSLTSYINQQTIGLLQGQLVTAEAELESLNRPREIVLEHRQLMRTAARDEKTLSELEMQYQNLKLDQARMTDPWELISTPTLLDKPVGPNRKRLVGISSLIGFLTGCLMAFIVDRRSGKVFSIDELRYLINIPILERLPSLNDGSWETAMQLMANGPLRESDSIALIPVGDLPQDQINQVSQHLKRALQNRKLLISQDLITCRDCSNQLLLTSPGLPGRKQLTQLREKLALQGTPVAGWLVIDPSIES